MPAANPSKRLGRRRPRNAQASGRFISVRGQYLRCRQVELFGNVLERIIKSIEVRAIADADVLISSAA
jgi:hypothetical protein